MKKRKWKNRLLAGLLSVAMILPAPAVYAKEAPKEQAGEGRKQQEEEVKEQPKEQTEQLEESKEQKKEVKESQEIQLESGEWKEEIKDRAVQDSSEVQKSAEVPRAASAAEDFSYYELQDGMLEITGYKGAGGAVEIPGEIDGKRVTWIGESAFSGCSSVTSIKIPESVTSIEERAFYECSSLTSVEIPESVRWIENSAFEKCSSLKSIGIPGSVTSIGDDAFSGCSNIKSIGIPGSVTSIGERAFYECSSLMNIEIPKGVTEIEVYTFYECSSLTSVEIPASITSIGDDAFSGCSGLESIVVDPGNTVYDSRDNCNAVIETESNTLIQGCKNTTIPGSVTSIRDMAFSRCSSLTSIEIPNSVTRIGESAFNFCISLKSIKIPDGVTSIGDYAFLFCRDLKSIEIPGSVTSIGNDAFSGCNSLTSIVVDSGNNIYDSRDNCNALIEKAGDTLILGCENTRIPGSVTSIGESAFDGCSNLTSIEIPESVTSIGEAAFYYCSGLTSIGIPKSVTSIGDYAFCDCSDLTSVTIPDSVTSIGEYAFSYCFSLTIYGKEGSYAQIYAKENGIPFSTGEPHNHTYTETVTPATTSKDGVITKKCSICEDTQKTVIAYPKTITLSAAEYTCDGKDKKPSVTVKDRTGKTIAASNYTVSYPKECRKPGTYTVTIQFKGNYSGKVSKTYTIVCKHKYQETTVAATTSKDGAITKKCSICGDTKKTTIAYPKTITLSVVKYTYNGKVQKPAVTVKDRTGKAVASSNYTVSYAKGCQNAGTYTVTVQFKNNYSGTVKKTFTIQPKGISSNMVSLAKTKYTYNGKVQKPSVTVKDRTGKAVASSNYAVSYTGGCQNAGTYTVIVQFKNNYSGIVKKSFTIQPKGISSNMVSLAKTKYTYNGKVQKPSVTVKDSNGKAVASVNYTVSYAKGYKNPGIYTVTIKFKNNYSGTAKKTFTICPKGTSLSKLTAAKKGFTVKWKKQSAQTSGYEIQYSMDSKFKKENQIKAVKKNQTTSQKISKLKAGKKYYVRIRTYKTVKVSGKSKKIYSDWSKAKSVNTKK